MVHAFILIVYLLVLEDTVTLYLTRVTVSVLMITFSEVMNKDEIKSKMWKLQRNKRTPPLPPSLHASFPLLFLSPLVLFLCLLLWSQFTSYWIKPLLPLFSFSLYNVVPTLFSTTHIIPLFSPSHSASLFRFLPPSPPLIPRCHTHPSLSVSSPWRFRHELIPPLLHGVSRSLCLVLMSSVLESVTVETERLMAWWQMGVYAWGWPC